MTRRAAILGLGQRGHTIAELFRDAGWSVSGFDPEPAALGAAQMADRKSLKPTISSAVSHADIVAICLPERLELMRKVIQRAQFEAPKNAVIAVLTAEHDIDAIQGCALRPDHVVRVNQSDGGGFTADVSNKTHATAREQPTQVLAELAAVQSLVNPADDNTQPPEAEIA